MKTTEEADAAALLLADTHGGAETASAPDPEEAAERAAMAAHHAAPPDVRPWLPGDPDPLRDGLLAGWRAGQRLRLGALAERLEDARPKRQHGVRELDRQAWQAAAREAAGLPSGEWAVWRAKVGTGHR